jgi:hypothetical protein
MSDPGSEYPLQVMTMVPLTFGIDFASGGAYTLPKTVEARLCVTPRPSSNENGRDD